MSIVRELGQTIIATDGAVSVVTCSTAGQSLASTANVIQSSAAYINNPTTANAGTGIVGRVIDRLSDVNAYDRYTVAFPAATLYSSRGSTEANRQMSIGVKLQHGNSSGGGDMVDLSTGSIPADATYFTTAGTTPMAGWTTGPFRAATIPAYFDLRAANRYIREVISVNKNRQTTESSGDEGMQVTGVITLLGGQSIPESQTPWLGVGSTTTTT